MLQVRISQTFGRIGIEQIPDKMLLKASPADYKLNQKPAVLQVEKDWPAVHIDQTQTRISMGYKPIVPFQKDIAREALSTSLSGIQRVAREGDRMGRIEDGSNPIPDIAEANAWPEKDFNVTVLPKTPPDISFTGRVAIKATPGDVTVDSKGSFPQVTVQRGNINVYVKVKPEVKIDVVGRQVDLLG